MATTPRIGDLAANLNANISTQVNAALAAAANPPPVALASGSIDVSLGTVFSLSVSAPATISFSNFASGKVIILVVANTAASQIALTFPTLVKDGNFTANLTASKKNVYTFVNIGGTIHTSVVTDLV